MTTDTRAQDVSADPLATEGAAPLPEPAASVVRATDPRAVLRSLRAPIAIALLLVITAFAVAFFRQRTREGALDPESVSPSGSRAIAQLLGDRGVRVIRVTALPEKPRDTVVFVAFAADLAAADLRLLSAPPDGVDVVLVAPTGRLDIRGLSITTRSAPSPTPRKPACALPAAEAAGVADAGGTVFEVGAGQDSDSVVSCYAVGGVPSLVTVERAASRVTLLGSGMPFTNERLDDEGNAALALGLLDRGVDVTWLMRRPAGAAPEGESQGILDLLPDGIIWGALQLLVAAVVAMVWRGRRLGPVVTEPLPVVVRAAEAVEGRGRLYASARAEGRAAWNLRRGAQAQLRALLALPSDATDQALVDGVAPRSQLNPADIGRLLYGPDPVDDQGLVRLAAELDALRSEVRRS